MQESFVDAAAHLGCPKVHPQPVRDRQPLSPTAQLWGGRDKDGGQVTMSRREWGAHPAPLHLPKPHWSSWLSGEMQKLSCPCSAAQTCLLSPHLPADPAPTSSPDTGKLPQGSGGAAQPRLPLPAQARGKEPDHPGWAVSSLQCGPGQPPADNRGFPTGTAPAGLELLPQHRELHPQPPHNFPPRNYTGKGKGVCTLSPFISGFLCC